MPEQMLVGEFLPPYYISQLGDSIIISGIFNFGDFRIIYAWELEVDDGEVSSYRQLFTIPYPVEHELKLLGFSKDKQPIVEASINPQWHCNSLEPIYKKILGNRRNVIYYENRYICAWLLEVEPDVVTSWRVLFIIPSQNDTKLLGFTMDGDPIVEVDSSQEMVHTHFRIFQYGLTRAGAGVSCYSFRKSPLAKYISPRDVSNAGFNMSCKVADFVANGEWHWPQPWLLKAPNIGTMSALILDPTSSDLIQWKNRKGSLRTQDKLRQWDVGNVDLSLIRCPLCDMVPDSHCHLFFECQFSSQVWCYVRSLADLENVPPLMHLILIRLISIAHQRSARSIIGRLVVAATTYFLWSERNNRLFKNSKRSQEEVWDLIMTTVRLKLLSFHFKNPYKVSELLDKWNMPSGFRIYGS
ncbi:reverse transcriptase zinc-binding domain-containing protein [Tanacetum coccineum]